MSAGFIFSVFACSSDSRTQETSGVRTTPDYVWGPDQDADTPVNGGLPGSSGSTGASGNDEQTPPPSSGGGTCAPSPGSSACGALALNAAQSVDGFLSDVFSWSDADCKQRSAAMVRNDRQDPAGQRGGYLRQLSYDVNGQTRVCKGSSSDHPGWGYTVNHFGSTSYSSRRTTGAFATPFVGAHHAIHQYKWTLTLSGQPVEATVQWLFATGRTHPLWTVTFDASKAPADAVKADTRAPYGDLQFDGGANADVAGVGWGDRYKFITQASSFTAQSGWDYSQKNTIPYVLMWMSGVDAEMGAVQTQTQDQHDAGGYENFVNWGKTSNGPMPVDYNWTYQLNQYELPFTKKSKRLAWGANYGAVGQRSYDAYGYGRKLSSYPYQSYSVFMVLDRHSEAPVFAQVAEMEAIQKTTLTATLGTVRNEGPAGVGRSDKVSYTPVGYNHVYSTWDVDAADDAVDVVFKTQGTLHQPIMVVHGYQGNTPQVWINGQCAVPNVDYYASIDATSRSLWITFAGEANGQTRVEVR